MVVSSGKPCLTRFQPGKRQRECGSVSYLALPSLFVHDADDFLEWGRR